MKITYLDQNEIRSDYQVLFWYRFSTDDIFDQENSYLDEFIHSDCFKKFAKPDIVRQAQSNGLLFLEGAFNLFYLELGHFKVLDKVGVIHFFHEYAQTDNWGKDRVGFISIMDIFFKLLERETSNKFFLINKEWFDSRDRILSQDSGVYTYYFLIIWISTDKKTINVCEWNYD